MRQVVLTILIVLSLMAFVMPSVAAERPEPVEIEVRGYTMYTLMKPGDIPPIMKPDFIGIAEADSFYHTDEPLIVVVYNGVAKGYSTWHLDHHEIVNDYIDGKAITVTW